jgi:hypothetical protein
MNWKRAATAIVVTQLAGLSVAWAQTPPPPDEDEAAPSDIGDPGPDDDGAEPVEPEEVVAEEVGEPEIERAAAPSQVGYDKGFFIKSGDGKYLLKISGRVQPFYAGTFNKGDGNDKHAFEVRRGRITLEGNAHTRSLTYKLQSDFGKGFLTLKDFHADVKLADNVWLRAGQWKRPFSRQQIGSSGRLELTDRSITDKAFGAGRDIGLAVHNNYEKSPDLEWALGVFNGTGDGARLVPTFNGDGEVTGGTFTNVPGKFRPVVVGRIGLNDGGIKGYSEADLEGGPLRWGAGASVWIEGDYDGGDNANQKVQLDYVVKASGFSTTGGFYAMTSQTDVQPFSSQELSHVGFHLQAGYMMTPKVQGAARFAMVDAQTDFEGGSIDDQQEISVGGNYFAFGHDAKLAGAVRFIKSGDAKLADSILLEIGANIGF